MRAEIHQSFIDEMHTIEIRLTPETEHEEEILEVARRLSAKRQAAMERVDRGRWRQDQWALTFWTGV